MEIFVKTNAKGEIICSDTKSQLGNYSDNEMYGYLTDVYACV